MNRRDALKAAIATVAGIVTGASVQSIPAASRGCSSKFTCGRITYTITIEPIYAGSHLIAEMLEGSVNMPDDLTEDEQNLVRHITGPYFRPGWKTTRYRICKDVNGRLVWYQARKEVWSIT